MKTNRHSLLAKGIMVLLSLLILIFAFTYSWFTNRAVVTADGISLTAETSGDFEYAIGFYNNGTGGSYAVTQFTSDATALNLKALTASVDGGTTYNTYDLLHDYQPIDITGDGVTLIRPSMLHSNTDINKSSDDYSFAVPNQQYINFDLYFRSELQGIPIYLADGSFAKAACENTVGSGALTDSTKASTYGYNKSDYGNFSKDAIVGATRIAITPYHYASQPTNLYGGADAYQAITDSSLLDGAHGFIWLPRPDIHVNSTDTLTGWTLSTATYPAAYSADDAQHTYYDIFEQGSQKQIATYSNTITPAGLAQANQLMANIDSNSFKYGDYYYTKVNVRIWVEGTDTEARRAFSGGRFEVNFKLSTNSSND